MCSVSAVVDQAHQWPRDYWTLPRINEFKEIIDRLDRIDKALGLPECDMNKRADLDKMWQSYGVATAGGGHGG